MQVVLANGTSLTASADSHRDLFWAMRGAGHQNFGIATSITYRAFPIPPQVPSFNVTFDVTGGDYEAAARALKLWRDDYVDAPGKEHLVIQPFFSATMGDPSSRMMALLAVLWEGSQEELDELMAPVAALGASSAGALVSNPEGVADLEVGCAVGARPAASSARQPAAACLQLPARPMTERRHARTAAHLATAGPADRQPQRPGP